MTNNTNAPERAWLSPGIQKIATLDHELAPRKQLTEYIRTDLYEALRADNAKLRRHNHTMRVALQRISAHRIEAHEYDADCGYEPREFGDEDFQQIERVADRALKATEGQSNE